MGGDILGPVGAVDDPAGFHELGVGARAGDAVGQGEPGEGPLLHALDQNGDGQNAAVVSRALTGAGVGSTGGSTPSLPLSALNSAVKADRKRDFVASASAGPSSAASSSTTVSQADENRLPR
jgi:hypothetical protein